MRKRDHKAAAVRKDSGQNDDESLPELLEKALRAEAALDEEHKRRRPLRTVLRSIGHRPVKYQLH